MSLSPCGIIVSWELKVRSILPSTVAEQLQQLSAAALTDQCESNLLKETNNSVKNADQPFERTFLNESPHCNQLSSWLV